MWTAEKAGIRPQLEAADHAAWRELIRHRCGLDFGETRGSTLSRCLWERMKVHGLASYDGYLRRVALGPSGRKEWLQLLELLVNCETSFFRHAPSFDGLRRVLPEVMAERIRHHRTPWLNLWSAGCSTGQEAYSMAMCALDATAGDQGCWQVRVTGSDISQVALEVAARGRYAARQTASLPAAYRRRHLLRVGTGAGATYEVDRHLRSIACFYTCNLVEPQSYRWPAQDVIFCQNLLIYLRSDHRGEVVGRLCRCLHPGGYLFLAPGEVLGLELVGMRSVLLDGCVAYQRVF